MIYELRTYTVKPGTAPLVAKNSGTVARDIRGDNYGKLEGYWLTEVGPLNQVMHLWSYSDLNERARLRVELSKNPRWGNEYLPAGAGTYAPPGYPPAERPYRSDSASKRWQSV